MRTLISGVAFTYEGSFYDILNALGNNPKFAKNIWLVDCLWVEGLISEAYKLMNAQAYLGDELLKNFSCLGENFVYFARIREYAASEDIDRISTFKDFSKSKCEMIVLVSDRCFYEIYAKDEVKLLSIQNILASLLSVDAKVIPPHKITRTELTV